MENQIMAEHLSFHYTDEEGKVVSLEILKDLSLTFQPGSFVAVLGHNGCGKSTLAKHMNAILLPTGGKMWVSGMDTCNEEKLYDIRQHVGMVFQNPDNQIIGTVVEEDVVFGPENMGVPTDEIWKRVDDSLKKTGMTAYRYQSPNKLSGGQKQRVAIAGVMAMRPQCIVLDEPTAMLDPNGRHEVLEAVSEGLDGKVVRVGNLMSRNSDGEFQINFITNGFLRSLRGYAAVGKFPMGGMHEVAEFSPIDSTALAVLRLAQTDRRFTVFHACNSHHIYMADLIYAMRSYGFRIDIVRDEEFEAAVKEFAKTGQDSDAVSGLIAYTSHNENEIYTIDYSNRFTAQVLYRLDYKWPVTDDRYLENAIAALDRLTFFD